MPIGLNRDLGKYGDSIVSGLESFPLGFGKNIRHQSGNNHIVGIDKVIMPSPPPP